MKVWSFLLQLAVSFTRKHQNLFWGSFYPFMKDRKWVSESLQGSGTLLYIVFCCPFSIIDFLSLVWTHYTVGKKSKFMCNSLVCIIKFLACTLIIKYLRGKVEENRAKKVPLRLKLIITQLFKCLPPSFTLAT